MNDINIELLVTSGLYPAVWINKLSDGTIEWPKTTSRGARSIVRGGVWGSGGVTPGNFFFEI